jgi:hypothetical protein
MFYSAWDWNKLQYNYFEGSGDLPGTRPQIVKVNEPTARAGRQIETLMPKLPSNAKAAGSGKVAKGRIVASAKDLAVSTSGSDLSPGLQGFGYGFGVDSVPVDTTGQKESISKEELSPLLVSPWKTLGMWFGVVWLSMKVAFWVGQGVEDSMRGKK